MEDDININDINPHDSNQLAEADDSKDVINEIEFIWHDPNINRPTFESLKELLKSLGLNSDIKKFDTSIYDVVDYVYERRRQTNFYVLTCGNKGEELVKKIFDMKNVKKIYVFCFNKEKHEGWANKYKPKLSIVENNINNILKSIIIEFRNKSQNLANGYVNLAKKYKFDGETKQAKENFLKSLMIYELFKNEFGGYSQEIQEIISNLKVIAKTYYKIGEMNKNLKCYHGAMNAFQECLDTYLKDPTSNYSIDKGNCYKNMGDTSKLLNNYETSYDNYSEALKYFQTLSKNNNDKIYEIINLLKSAANDLKSKGNYILAIKYFEKMIKIYSETKIQFDKIKKIECYINIANCYKLNMNYEKALEKYNVAMRISKESIEDIQNEDEIRLQKEIIMNIIEIYNPFCDQPEILMAKINSSPVEGSVMSTENRSLISQNQHQISISNLQSLIEFFDLYLKCNNIDQTTIINSWNKFLNNAQDHKSIIIPISESENISNDSDHEFQKKMQAFRQEKENIVTTEHKEILQIILKEIMNCLKSPQIKHLNDLSKQLYLKAESLKTQGKNIEAIYNYKVFLAFSQYANDINLSNVKNTLLELAKTLYLQAQESKDQKEYSSYIHYCEESISLYNEHFKCQCYSEISDLYILIGDWYWKDPIKNYEQIINSYSEAWKFLDDTNNKELLTKIADGGIWKI